MYIRMNVGFYKGEIRGPFHLDNARALIARGAASPTESIGDGRFRVIESEPLQEAQKTSSVEQAEIKEIPAADTATAPIAEPTHSGHKKGRR
jgi:hypothetical protein